MQCIPRGQGPGPGAYYLPPLVGYPKHDPSRYRSPQYSIRPSCGLGMHNVGPGPTYDISNMTRVGKAGAPAYSLTSKKKAMAGFSTPGPGAYTITDKAKNPAYTMSSRQIPIQRGSTPGPNQYNQPSSIGPKVPHLVSAPAYSIIGKYGSSLKSASPGPANYAGVPTDLYRQKPPKYTIPGKFGGLQGAGSPGPAAYVPNPPKVCNAGYSFGLRVCALPYITADDEIPCVAR